RRPRVRGRDPGGAVPPGGGAHPAGHRAPAGHHRRRRPDRGAGRRPHRRARHARRADRRRRAVRGHVGRARRRGRARRHRARARPERHRRRVRRRRRPGEGGTVIRSLFRVMDPAGAALLRRYFTALIAYCVVQGLTFTLLVPVLRALLDGDTAGAARWLAALAAGTVACWVLSYVQQTMGYTVSGHLLGILHRRIGAHAVTLPLGWFDGDRVGRLGQAGRQRGGERLRRPGAPDPAGGHRGGHPGHRGRGDVLPGVAGGGGRAGHRAAAVGRLPAVGPPVPAHRRAGARQRR